MNHYVFAFHEGDGDVYISTHTYPTLARAIEAAIATATASFDNPAAAAHSYASVGHGAMWILENIDPEYRDTAPQITVREVHPA